MNPTNTQLDPLFLKFQEALAGRYSIDRELGRGGMGVVYLAREVHLDRMVAIKLLPPDRAAESGLRERFLGEARLAAKLSHPNIIPIHAVEDRDGFVFYVMAFVDGETLTQRVLDRGPLPTSEGTRILREVAWALGYAHTQGLVHRDVKPDNILIESSTGRVLVADFGIAAAAGASDAAAVAGTPEFMSPEQALGGVIDARSDLYGLGATAFFAFSGRLPFEGNSATEVLAKQVTEPAPQLASLGLTVPRKLAQLVDRCLAKEPDQRPGSAQSLAEQLGLAIEQRREMPLALRAFVKRRGRIGSAGILLPIVPLAIGMALLAEFLSAPVQWGLFVTGMGSLFFAYLLIPARQLLLLGFDYEDVGPAFKSEIDLAREELGEERRPLARGVERFLGGVSILSAVVAVVAGGILKWGILADRVFGGWAVFSSVCAFSILSAIVTRYLWQALRRRTHDIDTESWARVWRGPIGKIVFAVARKSLGNRKRASAMTHRATELSLGMAAEHLFESLPKESQRALGDLPAVLQRLQKDAQALRKRYDELQEILGNMNDATVSSEFADLRQMRDSVHVKLGEAVGSLETIRLNLLRLHAGSATVAGVTTHLNLAKVVSDEVERLVNAHDDVDVMLRFPRLASNSGLRRKVHTEHTEPRRNSGTTKLLLFAFLRVSVCSV